MRQYALQRGMGLLLMTAVLLAGCSPRNAEEFRKSIGSGTHIVTTHDSFEVARPYQDVAAILRQKSGECLNVDVQVICTNCIGNRNMGKQTWTATYISTAERTEVHLQLMRTDLIQVGAPPKGDYEVLLDAKPLDKGRTKIDIYRLRPNTKFIHNAMKGWVKGETEGCPDLSSTQ
ncbi:MAG: hypothetical protein A2078_09325 [Nitrospirae bacterium GWC2_57_9]|nr:MAG: hypothetical protein A2078_09325 [Nitrospirae bacterium GWC2_57_9]